MSHVQSSEDIILEFSGRGFVGGSTSAAIWNTVVRAT